MLRAIPILPSYRELKPITVDDPCMAFWQIRIRPRQNTKVIAHGVDIFISSSERVASAASPSRGREP
jgi:hypothetical protein